MSDQQVLSQPLHGSERLVTHHAGGLAGMLFVVLREASLLAIGHSAYVAGERQP